MKIQQLAWVCVLLAGCQADGDKPGYIVLPGMVESLPYDAYDANPITGQTLRRAPDGTVPYGLRRYAFGPGAEEAARAGRELENPIEPTSAALKRGKERFDVFCAVCHGPAGHGDGPIIGRFPNPPSLVAPRAQGLPDGHLFHVIGYGQGIMAPYAVQIPADDRWRIVHYIRTLQGLKPSIASAATTDTAAAGEGGQGGGEGGSGGAAAAGGAAPTPASGGQAPEPAPVAPPTPAPAAPAPPVPKAPPAPQPLAPASPYDE